MKKKKILWCGITIGVVVGFICSILVIALVKICIEDNVTDDTSFDSDDLFTMITCDESKSNNTVIKFRASKFDKYDLVSTLPVMGDTTETGVVMADSAFTCNKDNENKLTFLRDQSFCQDFIVIKNYYKRNGDEKIYTGQRTADYASVNYDLIDFINENREDEMYNIRIEVIYDSENTYGIDNLLDNLIVEYDEEIE